MEQDAVAVDRPTESSSFRAFIERLNRQLSEFSCPSVLHKLTNGVLMALEQLNENVDYAAAKEHVQSGGQAEEEELEKAQQKMFSAEMRQRRRIFADLRRQTLALGLNSRKGESLNTDALTEKSVSGLLPSHNEEVGTILVAAVNNLQLNGLVRASAAARNVVVKLFAQYKPHENEPVSRQLTVEILNYLRGSVEFGQDVLIDVQNAAARLDTAAQRVEVIVDALRRLRRDKVNGGFVHRCVVCYRLCSTTTARLPTRCASCKLG